MIECYKLLDGYLNKYVIYNFQLKKLTTFCVATDIIPFLQMQF